MNTRRLIALLFLGCLVSTAHAGQRARSCGIALVGGLLIDGNGGVPIENSVVVIEGTRISAVGTTATVKVPSCAERIDVSGKTVMPGLINSNVHLTLYPIYMENASNPMYPSMSGDDGKKWRTWIEQRQTAEDHARRYLRVFLLQGITSVRSTSDSISMINLKREADHSEFQGARLFIGGANIGSPEWYDRIVRAVGADQEKNITWFVPVRSVSSVTEDLKKMEIPELNFWKLGLTGGDFGSGNLISDDVLKAIVQEGHRAGKIVDAHVTSLSGIRSGLDAGLDVMEHPNLSEPLPPELIEEYARKGVFLSPLHMADEGYVEIRENPDMLNDPIYKEFLSEEEYAMLQQLKQNLLRARQQPDRRFFDIPTPTHSNLSLDEWRTALEFCRQNLKNFIKAKTRIVMSTDAPGTPFNFPEMMWHVRELQTYVRYGMTPLQALQTATKNAAELLKMDKDLGTIEPGKVADVIATNGNPLIDMDALRHVDVVIKGGTRFK
jgi:imidazolonepropionase-like amidohydrolase